MAKFIDPSLEKARAYLTAQQHQIRPHARQPEGPPEGPYITISRESGTGAPAFAEMLATRLSREGGTGESWSVFGANLIESVLHEHGLSPRLAAFVPEGRVSEIRSLIGEIVGLHPNLWDLVQKTNRLIQQLARHGRVIVVGRGAAFATKNIHNGLHLRLVAPEDYRARFIAQTMEMSEKDAVSYNHKLDADRRSYVKAHFNASAELSENYDLVINVAHVPLAEAVETIVPLIRARTSVRTPMPSLEDVPGLARA